MKRRLIQLFIVKVVFMCAAVLAYADDPLYLSQVVLSPEDRILIFAAHPDDEVLGCSGVIQEAMRKRIPVKIVFFTHGDSNEWSFFVYRKWPVLMPKAVQQMGLVRYDEAIASTKLFGLSPDQLVFLGYPDFKTLNIWYSHWGARPPLEGVLTHSRTVPYVNAYRPGAAHKGEEILKDLASIIDNFRPTKVFLSHPADYNADHRALYLFVRVALWNSGISQQVQLYPYLIHYPQWPNPKGYHPKSSWYPPKDLKNEIVWRTFPLTPEMFKNKYYALKKHRSQYIATKKYLLSFIKQNELFGDFNEVVLNSDTENVALSAHSADSGALAIPEELIDKERASFIGVEKRTVRLEKDHLIMKIRLTRPLGKEVDFSLYLFGYRHDVPFERMPKLQIKCGEFSTKVLDQDKRLDHAEVLIERKAREITVKVPLSLLGDPQRILTSVHTYFLGTVPLDWVSWRILTIK